MESNGHEEAIDIERLEALLRIIGPAELGRMLGSLLREFDQTRRDLAEMVAASEPRAIGARAHAVKGAAASLGCTFASHVIGKVERAALSGIAEDFAALVSAYAAAVDLTAAALARWCEAADVPLRTGRAEPDE